MARQKSSGKSRSSGAVRYELICGMESSVNAIAWGCDALVHTLYDGEQGRVDGAVWVADKIREEARKMRENYRELFKIAAASRRK